MNKSYYQRCSWQMILCFLLLALLSPDQSKAAQPVSEYQIKAAFLYNLTHFVSWPPETFENSAPFTIVVYGEDPFGEFLDRVVEEEVKNERQLKVERVSQLDEISDTCRILFLGPDTMDSWQSILEKVAGRPVLTVSDHPAFTRNYGMVGLLKRKNKVEIEINFKQVRRANLNMSAKLLKVARVFE